MSQYHNEHQWCAENWPKAFPGGSDGKKFACNVRDQGRSLGWQETLEKGTATHSSILAWKIPGAWQATVHGVAKSQTWLSDFHLVTPEVSFYYSVLIRYPPLQTLNIMKYKSD